MQANKDETNMQRRRLIPQLSKEDITMIVDGRYLCYRTKYSRQVRLSYGEIETGIYYGFFNTLQSIANKFKIKNTIIAWDISKIGVRHDEFDGYKKREKLLTPEEEEEKRKFEEAYLYLTVLCSKLGFATYELPQYEADDIIALWCKWYHKGTNIIVTKDEDMYQLLTPNTSIYDPDNKKLKSWDWFVNKYGIPVSQWADYKAIAGCKSDTVPGIPTMGEVRTLEYLKDPKNSKWKEKIEKSKALYMLCYNLVVLPHPSLNHFWLPYKKTKLNENEFISFCQEFGMRSFIEKMHNFYIFM
jgi:DNA polymerase-1